MTSSEDIAQVFARFAPRAERDTWAWGTVREVGADGSVRVALGDGSAVTRCAALCPFEAGDRAFVAVLASGQCVAVGRSGWSRGERTLWENPDPSAPFAAKEVALDLSRLAFVTVVARIETDLPNLVSCTVPVGEAGCLTVAYWECKVRMFEASAGGVSFGDALNNAQYSDYPVVANHQLVPVRIMGSM